MDNRQNRGADERELLFERCVRETPAARPTPDELLRTPGALLLRTDLAQLGLGRRAIDSVFRTLPVVRVPGYGRPMVRVEDYLDLLQRATLPAGADYRTGR